MYVYKCVCIYKDSVKLIFVKLIIFTKTVFSFD